MIEVTVPHPSSRLLYRQWSDDDAPFVFEMYGLPEVYKFLGKKPAPIPNMEAARAGIERWQKRTFGMQGLWAVIAKAGEFAGTPIGNVILVPLPRSDEAPSEVIEIGWHFHPKAWGHGYATEAGRAVADRAKEFGLTEVHAVVNPTNYASLAVCERLNMTRLGETEDWYKETLVDHLLLL